jgi:tetratricopeptide (TPR) repeat protein
MNFSLYSEDYLNKVIQQNLDRGQWTRAADNYKKLIKLHPENINLRLRMAEVCVKSNLKKDALEQYQIIADYYIGLENYSKAITILRTMLNVDSGLSHIRIKLAELYNLTGDKENMWNQYLTAFKYLEEKKLVTQSVTVLEQMTKLNLDDTKLLVQLAEMFLARDLEPLAIKQYLSIAELCLQKSNLTEATKYYEQVLSIDADNKEAKKGLEVLQHLDDNKKQAITNESEPATPQASSPNPKPKTDKLKTDPIESASQDKKPTEPQKAAADSKGEIPAAKPQTPPAQEEEKPGISQSLAPEAEVPVADSESEISAATIPDPDEDELDNLLNQAGGQQIISEEDPESHYELGIVYQDMALVDAAIEEFVKAANDPNLQRKCYKMLCKCFGIKGMARRAKKYQKMYNELSLS